jgi:hypothetical protein
MYFLRKAINSLATSGNVYHRTAPKLSDKERAKRPFRHEIINLLLKEIKDPVYLEIGVRNPDGNFNKINATTKYSVDPGVEFEKNPVDFQMTSDDFFAKIRSGEVLKDVKFDGIFIDGLHLADQVERDIENALDFIKDDGYIIMHDCNPPSEWHARERYDYVFSPAMKSWNGTTWKAFVKARQRKDTFSCCIDTDWGVGIISKKIKI